MQRNSMAVVFNLFAESIGRPSKTAHVQCYRHFDNNGYKT